jgi:succinate dehydrogenase hydrophobic anchor subunit
MTEKSRQLSLKQRGLMNFESQMWLFTRLSALAMYALILFALFAALYLGARNDMNMADVFRWAFMPNVTHVQSTDVPDLVPWATIFWKITAILLMSIATAHGVHGLVVIGDDYIAGAGARKVLRLVSIVFMVAMIVIGGYVIWTSVV